MARRQRAELLAPADEKSVEPDHETAGLQFDQPGEDGIEIALAAGVENGAEPQRARRCLELPRLDLEIGIGPVEERADGCRRGDHAVQQLQPFRRQLTPNVVTPVRLPPGRFRLATSPSATGSTAVTKTIGMVLVAAFAANAPGLTGLGDHGDLPADQIGRQRRQPIVLLLRPAIFDRDIAALDKAGVTQALAEPGQPAGVAVGGRAAEVADHRHRRLLRACRERPRAPRRREAR